MLQILGLLFYANATYLRVADEPEIDCKQRELNALSRLKESGQALSTVSGRLSELIPAVNKLEQFIKAEKSELDVAVFDKGELEKRQDDIQAEVQEEQESYDESYEMANKIVEMLDQFSQGWQNDNAEVIEYYTKGVQDLQRKHESLMSGLREDKSDLEADIANKEGEITIIKSTIESYKDDLANYQKQEGDSKADQVQIQDVLEKLQEDLIVITNECNAGQHLSDEEKTNLKDAYLLDPKDSGILEDIEGPVKTDKKKDDIQADWNFTNWMHKKHDSSSKEESASFDSGTQAETAVTEEEAASDDAGIEEDVASDAAVTEEDVATDDASTEEEMASDDAGTEEEAASDDAGTEEEADSDLVSTQEEATSDDDTEGDNDSQSKESKKEEKKKETQNAWTLGVNPKSNTKNSNKNQKETNQESDESK